ncbi:MAG TPA: NUDIX domain-containing protein [Acidimicrobiales bacterium]|nr:NUDIX domain-containing protein [Acidimicrobiales bacterium]
MSDYVARLRALVGTTPLHMPTACVVVHDTEGRLLLVRKADSDLWSVPGGAVEPGERPEEAARREALEETGLEVAVTGLHAALGGDRCRTVYPNGDVLVYVAIVYRAVVVGGRERADGEEVSELGWFSPEALGGLGREGFVDLLIDEGLLTVS